MHPVVEMNREGRPRHRVWLANLVLMAAMFPNFSPLLLQGTDAQLFGFAISLFALAWLLIFDRCVIGIVKEDLILLGIGILYLVYTDFWTVPLDALWLRRSSVFLVGWPVYFAVRLFYRHSSDRTLLVGVWSYFASFALQSLVPSVSEFYRFVLPDIRFESGLGLQGPLRGAHGFALEPAMLSMYALVLLFSIQYFKPHHWRENPGDRRWMWILCLGMVIFDFSATGYAAGLFTAFLCVGYRRLSVRKVASGILAALVLLMALLFLGEEVLEKSRGYLLFSAVVKEPRILLEDESLTRRQIGTLLALDGLWEHPFGDGRIVMDDSRLRKAWNSPLVQAVLPTRTEGLLDYCDGGKLVSPYGQGIHRFGLLYFAFMGYLFSLVRAPRFSWAIRALMFITLLSVTPANSIIWFLVGCCVALRHQKRVPRKDSVSQVVLSAGDVG